ncbi:allophanate hydrolase [Cellulomonas endophytica]|uniref:allophanate hydrolase n=1 Tax=Cellulomonas endophytica TaxID=2494735 RepID=UPI00196A90C6|nr:allophanate hydrolase [Cellulomonas endophytica]
MSTTTTAATPGTNRVVPLPDDPRAHVAERYARLAAADRPEVWITLRPEAEVADELVAVVGRVRGGEELPLAGVLLAVKDNIDVAGLPTTAACPAFAYRPGRDAVAVARLRAAGAVVVGKTNLDQFATGLVGTRSPYGAVRHATHPDRVSGGSSSGSAVAVALGLVDAALGTDTAGSGRVPAAFHGLWGVKPTKGTVPATGVVPACRTQDVVTAMAADLDLARLVATTMTGPDAGDPLSRPVPTGPLGSVPGTAVASAPRLGVPATTADLGELAPGWAEAYEAAVARAFAAGAVAVPVDLAPFLAVARMLYESTFVAERYAAVGAFVDAHPDAVDPTVGRIIGGARDLPAWRLFADLERLDALRAVADGVLAGLDALLLPTTTQHPTLAAVAADPVGVNTALGRFTNFANLLDLAALAVPAGRVDGLPFGVQLVGPAFSDERLAAVARTVLA